MYVFFRKQKKTYETYLETLELVKRELDFRTRRSNDKLLEMLTASENGAKHISVKDCPKGQKEVSMLFFFFSILFVDILKLLV
jgi:hypothetical protein